ncbi:hypothetical protein FACS1894200_04910 [Spirochaetia bacterium]|nr:hypothetical protein FACS1894200_04910 [Spirochaetia bacterium]
MQAHQEISEGFHVSQSDIDKFDRLYSQIIKPKIKERFLSHLITTIEELINGQKVKSFIESTQKANYDSSREIQLLQNKNVRLYSIQIEPVNIKRRATTRYHNFGAIIYYNKSYEDKQVRILIAHELGHIVNKELLNGDDSENAANLFAYISMLDKNEFYSNECKKFIFQSDLSILHEIQNLCPIKSP